METSPQITLKPLATLPEFRPGDNLADKILAATQRENHVWSDDTIVVIAQKVVSKVEGQVIDLRTIEPSPKALRFAEEFDKDARLVELVLRESRRIVRMERGVIISETRHGFVCANAGIDRSNVEDQASATLLPADPDASARSIREELRTLAGLGCGVIISDSFGRPWRVGQVDVAIGVAGIAPLDDRRGSSDRHGRTLTATCIAIADEIAGAAGLLMQKDAGCPVVLVEGCKPPNGSGTARDLVRGPESDLFR